MNIQQGGTARRKQGRWMVSSACVVLLLFAAGPAPGGASGSAAPTGFAMREMYAATVASASDPAEREVTAARTPQKRGGSLRSPHRSDGALLTGRVHCKDGPVPGMRIAVTPSTAMATGGRRLSSFSDQTGKFRLRWPLGLPQQASTQHFVAWGADGKCLLGPPCPSLHQEQQAIDWMIDARLVAVRICDEAGNGVANRRVAWEHEAGSECFAVRQSTDAEGLCVALLRGGTQATLRVTGFDGKVERARFEARAEAHTWMLSGRAR